MAECLKVISHSHLNEITRRPVAHRAFFIQLLYDQLPSPGYCCWVLSADFSEKLKSSLLRWLQPCFLSLVSLGIPLFHPLALVGQAKTNSLFIMPTHDAHHTGMRRVTHVKPPPQQTRRCSQNEAYLPESKHKLIPEHSMHVEFITLFERKLWLLPSLGFSSGTGGCSGRSSFTSPSSSCTGVCFSSSGWET